MSTSTRSSRDWLPTLHAEGLIDAVDVFCENIAFNVAQSERLFDAAHDLGCRSKCTRSNSPISAARRWPPAITRCRVITSSTPRSRMPPRSPPRERSRCCCRLPSIAWRMSASRPIQAFRSAGAAMALATRLQPGLRAGDLAAAHHEHGDAAVWSHFGRGAGRRHAQRRARPGLAHERGTLAPGKAADFVIWNVRAIEELSYWIGFNPRRTVVRAGRIR